MPPREWAPAEAEKVEEGAEEWLIPLLPPLRETVGVGTTSDLAAHDMSSTMRAGGSTANHALSSQTRAAGRSVDGEGGRLGDRGKDPLVTLTRFEYFLLSRLRTFVKTVQVGACGVRTGTCTSNHTGQRGGEKDKEPYYP